VNVAVHCYFQYLVVTETGLVVESDVLAVVVEKAAIVGAEVEDAR